MSQQQETRSKCCNATIEAHGSTFQHGRLWHYCLMCGQQIDAEGSPVNWREVGSPDDDFRNAIEGLERWARFQGRPSRNIYSRTDYVLAQRSAFFTGATWQQRTSGVTGDSVIEYEAARIFPGPDLISLPYKPREPR